MDWVHCNRCFAQPGDVEGKKFVITNCGHIYCSDCIKLPEMKEKCRICQASYRTMPLSSDMSPDVEIYFRDPTENIQKIVKVLEFQRSHRIRLTEWKNEKFKHLEKEESVLKEKLKRAEKENASLREYIKRINGELNACKEKIMQLQNSPRYGPLNPLGHFYSSNLTPTGAPKLVKPGTESGRNIFVRPSQGSDFLIKSKMKMNQRDTNMFTMSNLLRMHGSSRSLRSGASDISTPLTPNSSSREVCLKDPLCKKIKLPGDRSGPSPATRLAFQHLTLSKLTSTPKNNKNHKIMTD